MPTSMRPNWQNAWPRFKLPFWNALSLATSDLTTSDTTLPIFSGLYCGVTGTVVVQLAGNNAATPQSFFVLAGTILDIRGVRVATTGTTVGTYIGLYPGPVSA